MWTLFTKLNWIPKKKFFCGRPGEDFFRHPHFWKQEYFFRVLIFHRRNSCSALLWLFTSTVYSRKSIIKWQCNSIAMCTCLKCKFHHLTSLCGIYEQFFSLFTLKDKSFVLTILFLLCLPRIFKLLLVLFIQARN